MEDTLGVFQLQVTSAKTQSLNPCFNGRYSRRHCKQLKYLIISVLILVLMEDTLGDVIESLIKAGAKVLILVLMEDTLGALYS